MTTDLKEGTSLDKLAGTLSLISLKIAQLHSQLEVHLGDDFLLPKEKLMFAELYKLANRDFVSDEPDLGKLYGDDEIEMIKIKSLGLTTK